MSVYRERMAKSANKVRTKALDTEEALRVREEALREQDLARVLERLAPLQQQHPDDAARALRAHLHATARDRGTTDPEIAQLDQRIDEYRRRRSESRATLRGMEASYQAQERLKQQEIEWDEILESHGRSQRLPRTRGSRFWLVTATVAVLALELGLLAPPLTSLVRDQAPSLSTTAVGIIAVTVVAVLVGAGATAIIIAGRQYKEYLWARSTEELAEEVNAQRRERGLPLVPYERANQGGFLGAAFLALLIQAFLFVMRFIAEDSGGQIAQLAVAVSFVATLLPVILFVLEKEHHDPKRTDARGYDPTVIETYARLHTEVTEHIPRKLLALEAERALRAQALILQEVERVRRHALSLPPALVYTLDQLAAEAEAEDARIRNELRIADDLDRVADPAALRVETQAQGTHHPIAQQAAMPSPPVAGLDAPEWHRGT